MQRKFIILIIITLFLSACAELQSTNKNEPVCNELKHQIIFNGATQDPQEYMHQQAQLGEMNREYRKEGC